jgi:hypothetical protein
MDQIVNLYTDFIWKETNSGVLKHDLHNYEIVRVESTHGTPAKLFVNYSCKRQKGGDSDFRTDNIDLGKYTDDQRITIIDLYKNLAGAPALVKKREHVKENVAAYFRSNYAMLLKNIN